jgi:hypothetical protein
MTAFVGNASQFDGFLVNVIALEAAAENWLEVGHDEKKTSLVDRR